MPYINISLFPGQPKAVKVRIAEKITAVIREETPQVPEQNIWVTFSEIPADEWSIGGKMCAGSKD
jgi:phenylpyruvate tautomerase PptA (4-oxalocrotonate tautomerase family)